MIAGFEEPDAGEIRFDERPVTRTPAHRRNTALVFQNYALWPHMSVEENVAYGLAERRVARAAKRDRTLAALKAVRMQEYTQRSVNQLSGGQQQRVALARALVIEPDVVLMDEPLSNLDAKLRIQMREEIRRIHDEIGITMVYVTHDQKEALCMADTVAVMSMGRIAQVGSPREVYRRPANRFVADFIGGTNVIPGKVLDLAAEWGRIETPLGVFRCRLGAQAVEADSVGVCMVRPESLRVDAAPAVNQFRATVHRGVYLGELEELELATAWQPIRAVVSNPGESARPAGTTVMVGFDADDALILAGRDTEFVV
jgi:iron(III) transport system ATP-binding protein